ncbi:MAG: YhfC family intramembrane metalloprotease [Oscillospiraceae bacterium]|nr:YhfC family intramembrane metalloprotease [Oscillospiraceae bacterium]
MIPVSTILACVFTLFVSLILPVLILIVFAVKNKDNGIWSAWFIGAAGFIVPQLLIRLPILSLLSAIDGFASFMSSHLLVYALFLAFTAGLFELAGRYAAAKLLTKKLNFKRSLVAGLGHGGIEAMAIVGISFVNNLAYIFLINSGSFDAVLVETAAAGIDTAQLEAIRESFLTTSPVLFLLAGYERLLTMVFHAAMSMIVCYAVHSGKPRKGLLVCLALHTLLDCGAGITLLINQGTLSQALGYTIIYTIMTAVAILSLLILKHIRTRWPDPAPIEGGTL